MRYYHLVWCCPYYNWDARTAVHCEGGRIDLPSGEAAREYFEIYCSSVEGWRRCTVARAITRFYEKKDGE